MTGGWVREDGVEFQTCGDCDRCLGGRHDQCHVQIEIRKPAVER